MVGTGWAAICTFTATVHVQAPCIINFNVDIILCCLQIYGSLCHNPYLGCIIEGFCRNFTYVDLIGNKTK